VQELKTHGAGNLFVKTHPEVQESLGRRAAEPEKDVAESVAVYDLTDLTKKPELINIAKLSGLPESKAIKRAVHPEYDATGTEVWISLWAGKTEPSAIVVMDDKTRKVKKVITDPQDDHPDGQVQRHQHPARRLLIRRKSGAATAAPFFAQRLNNPQGGWPPRA
jgi:nitrite reductase (NO-forming)/hydroxylamine reductase